MTILFPRHCEKSQTLWQSLEYYRAVTRLPRFARSDKSGGLRSQDHHVAVAPRDNE